MSEVARLVGDAVLRDYDIEDGSDLCYNLLQSGQLSIEDSIDALAHDVAHLLHFQ